MSPDKLVDENDPSTWVAKTKVAPVKFTKWFLFNINPYYSNFLSKSLQNFTLKLSNLRFLICFNH